MNTSKSKMLGLYNRYHYFSERNKRFNDVLNIVFQRCLEELYNIFKIMGETHDKKSHDYGGNKDPLTNLRLFGWKGIVVRLGDKYCRLLNFANSETLHVKDENIIDTFIDSAVYSVLGVLLYKDDKLSSCNALTLTEIIKDLREKL